MSLLRRSSTLLAAVGHSLRRHADRWLLAGTAFATAAAVWGASVTIERRLFEHVIVLDITQSMNVEDTMLAGKPVSRLTLAKHALRESLTRLPCGSKVGWAVFTEYRSFLLFAPVEVCANLRELRATLDRIDGRMAWTGNSEVAKGLYAGIAIAGQLPARPSVVFVSDGHEAPPINPRHRPRFNGVPGEIAGLVVGVGNLKPMPIPKTGPTGAPLGFWGADEVLQVDPRTAGRGGSVGSEKMVEDPDAPVVALPVPPPGGASVFAARGVPAIAGGRDGHALPPPRGRGRPGPRPDAAGARQARHGPHRHFAIACRRRSGADAVPPPQPVGGSPASTSPPRGPANRRAPRFSKCARASNPSASIISGVGMRKTVSLRSLIPVPPCLQGRPGLNSPG